MIPYNPHIQYYEGDRRGYFKATVTPAQMRLDLRFVTTVESPIAFAYTEKSWVVTDGVAGAINKVVPATKTTTTETPTSSTTTSSTSFVLVPGETVQVQESVGKKVEFTGTLIPAGNIRSGTTARTEREDAPDTKTRERIETKNSAAQFRVTSIKTIGAC
jgi:hypothetical protein